MLLGVLLFSVFVVLSLFACVCCCVFRVCVFFVVVMCLGLFELCVFCCCRVGLLVFFAVLLCLLCVLLCGLMCYLAVSFF